MILLACWLGCLVLLPAARADEQESEPEHPASSSAPAQSAIPSSGLLFAKAGSLWRVEPKGKGSRVEVLRVGDPGTKEDIVRIELSLRGDVVLVETAERVFWARLDARGRGEPPRAAALDCKPRAYLSPDGARVVCEDASGKLVLFVLRDGAHREVLGPAVSSHLGFVDVAHLVISNDRGLWSMSLGPSRAQALLSPDRPDGAFLVAPGGKRAVAVYTDQKRSTRALYAFALDGKSIRRRLLKDGEPVAWSHDGAWLLVQRGHRACLVRATGGQYKCWSRHQAVAIAPDGSYAVLARPEDSGRKKRSGGTTYRLYRAARDGVRPAQPVLIREGAHAAAAWLPEH